MILRFPGFEAVEDMARELYASFASLTAFDEANDSPIARKSVRHLRSRRHAIPE